MDNRVFQHNERSNLSCFPKIPKFYFIVGKRFQFIQEKEDPITPTNLFQERNEVDFQIPFCNETKMKYFVLLTNRKRLPTTK